MTVRPTRRSPLAMMVLALLMEQPMHAYRMQQLIQERNKQDVVNVAQRNSVYQAIERLRRDELIRVSHTTRDERRPERTVYELTSAGHQEFARWLAQALAVPAREFPEFPAALSLLPLLSPDAAAGHLERRAAALAERLARTESTMATVDLPRLFLVEDEYQVAMLRTELDWVTALVTQLRTGELSWPTDRPADDH